ncbi:hypothetical protein CYMTET_19212 [Cymbomonas tetramitiformis]|uniref:Uncharacterized protein n=1 Tax=Cymbomonas tetramitiformis TaxID=36881 RepID=A0AAE0L5I8_9CHLO|nr:hypothetical protein CYMTET_19212 [Cymbomonas tetramitiformis]
MLANTGTPLQHLVVIPNHTTPEADAQYQVLQEASTIFSGHAYVWGGDAIEEAPVGLSVDDLSSLSALRREMRENYFYLATGDARELFLPFSAALELGRDLRRFFCEDLSGDCWESSRQYITELVQPSHLTDILNPEQGANGPAMRHPFKKPVL